MLPPPRPPQAARKSDRCADISDVDWVLLIKNLPSGIHLNMTDGFTRSFMALHRHLPWHYRCD